MDRKAVQTSVRLEAETNGYDGLMYMDCPECGKANKMMVGTADEGGFWFKCLSAGCPTFGTTSGTARVPKPEEPSALAHRKIYPRYQSTEEWRELPLEDHMKLSQRFGLSVPRTYQLCRGKMWSRFVYPVYDTIGVERGYVLRGYNGEEPKSLLRPYYGSPDLPLISWYFTPEGELGANCLAVVEDQVSAAKLSMYMPAVSLLGTTIDWHSQQEVLRVAENLQIDRICVILDNDAQMQALPLAKKFSGKGVPIPVFHEDVKDMGPVEMDTLVGVCRGTV